MNKPWSESPAEEYNRELHNAAQDALDATNKAVKHALHGFKEAADGESDRLFDDAIEHLDEAGHILQEIIDTKFERYRG